MKYRVKLRDRGVQQRREVVLDLPHGCRRFLFDGREWQITGCVGAISAVAASLGLPPRITAALVSDRMPIGTMPVDCDPSLFGRRIAPASAQQLPEAVEVPADVSLVT